MTQAKWKIKPRIKRESSVEASALIGDLMRLEGAFQKPHGALDAMPVNRRVQ